MAHQYRINCPRCGNSYSKLLHSECPTCKEADRRKRYKGYYVNETPKKQRVVYIENNVDNKSLVELESELKFITSKCDEIDNKDYMYRYYKNRKTELERKIKQKENEKYNKRFK